MAIWQVLFAVVGAGYLLYRWSISKYNTFRERGIPHDPPKPFLGNLSLDLFKGKTSLFKIIIEMDEKFRRSKVYGFYNSFNPMYVIRDVELIKKVAIKNFDHFTNRRHAFSEKAEPFLGKSLFSLQDTKWKDMRTALTPAFTGSKMRLMIDLINNCTVEAIKDIYAGQKRNGTDAVELEMKDFFTRFTNDVIASTAFGLKVNSFTDKDNEFITIGHKLTNFSVIQNVKLMLIETVPKIMQALRITFLNRKLTDYFYHLVFESMKYRREHNIHRPDMIHLLMEAQRDYQQQQNHTTGVHNEFNDLDLLAQCLLFFFAGFDSVSTCLSFTTYELLQNPIEQEQLHAEIVAMESELNGKPIDYDAISKMKYLDMVVSESLRKWPPGYGLDRACNADIKLLDDNGDLIVDLRKGDAIFIPTIGIHLDPANFTDPLRFDPERFSEERKHEIKPYTYMPFGLGPRSCIGNRLALMEVKVILYYLVLNFKIQPTERTSKDMLNSLTGMPLMPKERFWTKFVARNRQ